VLAFIPFAFGVFFMAGPFSRGDRDVGFFIFCGSLPIFIAASICFWVWLYQAWLLVPEDLRPASPGLTIAFMFIPFFNFYWIFRAIPELSSQLTIALGRADSRRTHGAGYGIGLAASIVSLIPYVNILAFMLFIIWIWNANSACNKLRAYFVQDVA
jgi:hypothetical protein